MTFPSGAVTLDIWMGDDFATVQGVPSRAEWGVSVNPPSDGGFGTHDRHFDTAEEALEEVRRLISGSRGSSPPPPGPGAATGPRRG